MEVVSLKTAPIVLYIFYVRASPCRKIDLAECSKATAFKIIIIIIKKTEPATMCTRSWMWPQKGGDVAPSLQSCGSSVILIHGWWQTDKCNLHLPFKACATPLTATAGQEMWGVQKNKTKQNWKFVFNSNPGKPVCPAPPLPLHV